jgi:hypothetical protein
MPLEGDAPAWLISLAISVAILFALALFGFKPKLEPVILAIVDAPQEEIKEIEPPEQLPQEFAFSDIPVDEIGAQSIDGTEMAESLAPKISDVSEVPTALVKAAAALDAQSDLLAELDEVKLQEAENKVVEATGTKFSENATIKGAAGVGTTGATGAIDRITYEILQSLAQRKTLVVWLFDNTVSLTQQRKQIHDRFDRIYRELGVIEAAGNPAFAKHEDKPLLTSVMSFGNSVSSQTRQPTDNLTEIKLAVSHMPVDRSGREKAFEAIFSAADQHKKYVTQGRNVMIVAFTDEVGDDQAKADDTIKICRKFRMPVYVVGVPAPFGRDKIEMKWIDPDPKYDQSPQWGVVEQGPESRFPEIVKVHFTGAGMADEPMDSGYGPYSLTKLAYETGGIYFAVHPNRNSRKPVTRDETANLSAHIRYFFDPDLMRKYRPDYVSEDEYRKLMNANKAKAALVQAAMQPNWITPLGGPALRFPKRDEADLARRLSEAQKAAAKLEPQIGQLYSILKNGEPDRPKLDSPRWEAAYDLAMGRVMAVKVRTEAYNAMLAKAKTMKFKNPKNDTWDLEPADAVDVGSVLEKEAAKAKDYLNRVVKEHAGTPWAMLAQRELATPLGWAWKERFTGVNTPRMPPPNNNAPPPPPADDKARVIKKPPPKRPPPPL